MERGLDACTARHRKLLFPASAYISGIAPPTLSNKMNGDAIVIEDTKRRRVQRVVASDSFYAYRTGRYDNVLITKKFCETLMNDTPHEIDCWFGKIIYFVKINNPKAFRNHSSHDAENCIQCDHNPTDDLRFVQWYEIIYEIIDENLNEIDAIDKQLNCVSLRC